MMVEEVPVDDTRAEQATSQQVPQSTRTQDELRWGGAAHFSVLIALLGVPGPVGPLAVWLIKKGESSFIDAQVKEALNFSLSALMYFVGLVGLIVVVAIGGNGEGVVFLALMAVALVLASLVLPVVAGVRASSGEAYRYPLTVRFV